MANLRLRFHGWGRQVGWRVAACVLHACLAGLCLGLVCLGLPNACFTSVPCCGFLLALLCLGMQSACLSGTFLLKASLPYEPVKPHLKGGMVCCCQI